MLQEANKFCLGNSSQLVEALDEDQMDFIVREL